MPPNQKVNKAEEQTIIFLNINVVFHIFKAIGFFNEADTLECSSILIYCYLKRGFYSRCLQLIKSKFKLIGFEKKLMKALINKIEANATIF
jgi:hypothetical protein